MIEDSKQFTVHLTLVMANLRLTYIMLAKHTSYMVILFICGCGFLYPMLSSRFIC